MIREDLDDEAMASRVRADGTPCDRSTISRLRREKHQPTWQMAARIKAVTGGAVTADDYLPLSEAAE